MAIFRVLGASLAMFFGSLPIALLLAFASLTSLVGLAFFAGLQEQASVLVLVAWVVFAHIGLALFLTAWNLRRTTPHFALWPTVLRALGWSIAITAVVLLIGAGVATQSRGVEDFSAPLAPPSRWAPAWLWTLAVWAVICGVGLPARLMLGRRPRKVGAGDIIAIVIAVSAWLAVIDTLSLPARTCQGECWGVMEGGVVMIPLLGMWLFLLTAGAAAMSAAAWSRTMRPLA